MLTIAGGVILGGIGLVVFFVALPWLVEIAKLPFRIFANVCRRVGSTPLRMAVWLGVMAIGAAAVFLDKH